MPGSSWIGENSPRSAATSALGGGPGCTRAGPLPWRTYRADRRAEALVSAVAPVRRNPWIRAGGERDAGEVGELLLTAFGDGPLARWLVPDAQARADVLGDLFALVAQEVTRSGTVQVFGDFEAVALWSGEPPGSFWGSDRYAGLLAGQDGRWEVLARGLTATPVAGAEYLVLLAVRPLAQRHGLAGQLLTARHAAGDAGPATPRPVLVHVVGDAVRRLYERHGYYEAGPAIDVPGGPQVQPLRRDPGACRA
jgi:hypothetical protein